MKAEQHGTVFGEELLIDNGCGEGAVCPIPDFSRGGWKLEFWSRDSSVTQGPMEGQRQRLCGPGHNNQSGGQEESVEFGKRKIEDDC